MKDEIRKLVMQEAKRSGKNLADVASKIDNAEKEKRKAEEKALRESRRKEAEAKNLRIQEDSEYFTALIQNARVKEPFFTEIAKAFPLPEDASQEEKDNAVIRTRVDGYFALIGVTPEHNVLGGRTSDFWDFDKIGKGTWRNGKRIQDITHIAIVGYQLEADGMMDRISNTILNSSVLIPTVGVFGDNHKNPLYPTIDELKADIADVLSKIYGLPNPLEKGE